METLIFGNGNIEIKAEGGKESGYDRDTFITINGKEFIQISSHDIANFRNDFLKVLEEYQIAKMQRHDKK